MHEATAAGATGWPVVGAVPLALLALLAAAAGAAAWTARSRARRRVRVRRGSTVLLLALALLGAGATAADAVNTGFGYLPRVGDVLELPDGGGPWPEVPPAALRDPAARFPDGGVLALPVAAGGTGLRDAPALVWLPPQYFTAPTERFPVVYLFHGSPGVPEDWLRGGGLARTALDLARAGHPAVVVMPRTSRGWLDDPECVDGVHEQVETWVWQQLVPTVDGALRTVPTRDGRALAGMSAGGFCALDLGLKHRDRVATVLDLSGLVEPTHRGGLTALYGPDAARLAPADTPRTYAPTLPPAPTTRVWLDAGTGDGEVRPGLERLAPVLRARGLDVQLHERPGGHTFRVWRPALAQALAWALPQMAPAGPA